MQTIPLAFTWMDAEQAAGLSLPIYASALAAGMDVAAAISEPLILEPGDMQLVGCGFAVAIPEGFEIQVRPRSGLAIKHGISIINAPGTIDADYRGEIKIGLINLSRVPYTIQRGDRIAQLVLAPALRAEWQIVDELPQTQRGSGGFGHTGLTALHPVSVNSSNNL